MALGVLTVLSGTIGVVATFTHGCCLMMYFCIGFITFLLQASVLVGLIFFYDWVRAAVNLTMRCTYRI